jgi:hypothetical protein
MTSRSDGRRTPPTHADASGPPPRAPRLGDLRAGAAYLGVSYWTFRDWVLAGLIPVVELPPLRPREGAEAKQSLRRVLIDFLDLDRFVEARKSGNAPDVHSRVHQAEAQNTGPNRRSMPGLCPRRGGR